MSAVGLIGSVAGIASEGLKLSETLFQYYNKFKRADSDLQSVAIDVNSTSIVLKQLVKNLEEDERDHSENSSEGERLVANAYSPQSARSTFTKQRRIAYNVASLYSKRSKALSRNLCRSLETVLATFKQLNFTAQAVFYGLLSTAGSSFCAST